MRRSQTLPLLVLVVLLWTLPALAMGSTPRKDDSPSSPAAQPAPVPLAQEPSAEGAQNIPQFSGPIHMDKDLAREHERFSRYALEQIQRMNATMLGGRAGMQVRKGHDGLYHASYKAIDEQHLICQVRRSETNPQFYVGTIIYKEQLLEGSGLTADACRNGAFQSVSEKDSRIIYTSKRGGGWQ